MKTNLARAMVFTSGLWLIAAAGAANEPATSPPAAATPSAEPIYAVVNGKPITVREFQSAYANHVRSEFYHREGIAEERLQAARENVSEKLIERILLVEEVARRKLEADESKVNEAIAGYEKRYANSPMWQQNKERLLPGLRDRLMEENRLERLETAVRAVGDIPEQEIRRFYDERPELFTEPAKLRLHTILLKVAPSAPTSEWDNAKKKAEELIADLRRGANFEELARKHSHDKSASDGGDMGYLHLGMLPEPLQARIDKLAYGDISEPIEVLEGVGVFRLDERVAPRHVEFSQVMERARDLLKREKQQQQWRDFVAGLRKSADVRMGIQPLQSRAN